MIRLRRGALLVVGVGLLFVALSFPGAVATYAVPHDGQEQTARLHAPVGVRLAEPFDVTSEKEPVVRSPSAVQPPGVEAPAPRATKGASLAG